MNYLHQDNRLESKECGSEVQESGELVETWGNSDFGADL